MRKHIADMSRNEMMANIALIDARKRLAEIAEIISVVDNRCLAADGPVTKTRDEITDAEMRRMYKLATFKARPK